MRGAAERDHRDARADRAVLVLPELQGAADVPGDDRPQAQPRRHRLVLDHDGGADLDAAGRQRDAGALAPARPGSQRAVRARRCRGSGSRWIVFPLWIYIFAVVKPIVNALKGGGALTYLETNGILDAGLFYLLGIVIYFVMQYRARAVRRGREDAVHRTAARLSGPRHRHAPLHSERPARRREGVAEVRQRDPAATSTRPTSRCSPATSRARRSCRSSEQQRPLRDRAVRRAPLGARSTRTSPSSSATSPTSATTRS